MSIHQSAPTKWVPITDEIVRSLEGKYLNWIGDLTEIRERMNGLRDAHRTGWKASDELRARLADLHKRDETYAAKHMDVARAFLDAAEADIEGTKAARAEQRAQLIEMIGHLRHAWENGWQTAEPWTVDERNEIVWLLYCNPELQNLYRIAARNTLYFWSKFMRLFQKCEVERNHEATRHQMGMVPRLGIKKFGKQIGRVRR